MNGTYHRDRTRWPGAAADTVRGMTYARIVDALLEGPIAPSFTRIGYEARKRLFHFTDIGSYSLAGRVIVNRVWQVYFGRGIVETENDFGILGTLPSRPAV